ncbi:MAG: YbaB/EbfC family nucleoid-associated protein [Myxococcales bacterium]|jgi:DNA-binding YbaB/EbfC family protein|nr:YbaB/EbfC family nucleoid-associated protein [Myxococcales bacterium]MBL0193564.1 YbaB/EbfC family nucleoid-associated protein [Myxococcales bacterium]HQY64923.1 YbaB/EbfC family nucleoid-associated protein [Polyangiaceae bacterium]
MQFRGGMTELMRQAARIQRKIDQTKEELKDKEVVFSSAGDKVKATATFGGKVARIEVDPEFLAAEGLDLTLDAVCAAVNGAIDVADKAMAAELEKATGGVKIPGLG